MGFSRWVHILVEKVVRETEKAFLCQIDGEEHWLPKSQISDPDDYGEGNENCEMSVTEFIAREKGFSDE